MQELHIVCSQNKTFAFLFYFSHGQHINDDQIIFPDMTKSVSQSQGVCPSFTVRLETW